MVNIWEFHIKQAKTQECFPLPVIIPLVFYTGEGDYSGCRIGLDKHDRFVIELMKYILNINDEHRDVKEFISLMHNKLQPKLEEEFMTLADHIAEKGRQEGLQAGLQAGRQEGIMNVAIKLLQENTDPVFVAKITGLSLDQIKKIKFSNVNGIIS